MNTEPTDAERRERWCDVRLKRAWDITPYDVIRWRGEWTTVFDVFRDINDYLAVFGTPEKTSAVLHGEGPDNPDDKLAWDSLDWAAPTWVLLRLFDLENSNPGESADKWAKVYMFDLIEVQSLPAYEPQPEPAKPSPGTDRMRATLTAIADGLTGPDPIVTRVTRGAAELRRLIAVTEPSADADLMDEFTEGLLAGVARDTDGRATGRLGLLANAVIEAVGTDADTAEWQAARVIGTIEAMAIESGAYADPGNRDPDWRPWNVQAWLKELAQPAGGEDS